MASKKMRNYCDLMHMLSAKLVPPNPLNSLLRKMGVVVSKTPGAPGPNGTMLQFTIPWPGGP
jgi:hypothetical protein